MKLFHIAEGRNFFTIICRNEIVGDNMKQNEKDYEFMLKVKEAYEASSEGGEGSIRSVAIKLDLSRTKVRKILVTLGVIKNNITDQALFLKEQGMTLEEIADEMGLSMATVSTYLPYDTILYNGEEKSYNAVIIDRYRQRNKNSVEAQVHNSNKNISIYEDEDMRERQNKIYKLHLELNMDGVDMEVLKKYGKVKSGISRDILVPSDITLHALHYVIQRAFGWQNSHLHHFELPNEIFEKMTDNHFLKWADYCGIYFRFPNEDMDDVYWDDDYSGDVCIKTWYRKKYSGLYQYHGISEHLMEARQAVSNFMENTKQITVMPPFAVWMTLSEAERRNPVVKLLNEATCDEIDAVFSDGSIRELLERLKLSELLAEDELKPVSEDFIMDTLDRAAESYSDFVKLHNAMIEGEEYEYWRGMTKINGTVHPITKTLLYQYDYGDGWEVKIDIEDVYYSDSEWDHPNKAGYIVPAMTKEQVYDEQTPLYRNGEIIEGELAEQIRMMIVNCRPICIAADGLPVIDDVGGMCGYCNLLLALHRKDNTQFETAEEAKEWVSGMGWNGRMNKPEKIL